MKKTMAFILAIALLTASLALSLSACGEGEAEPTPVPQKREYVYPGENKTMMWKNPAYTDEKYAEGAEYSEWVNAKNDTGHEYSYTGTVHWIENRDNHIFSVLCLPSDFDGTQKYPLVVMLHGFNSTLNEYDYFVNYLTDAGFALLMFDFRGGHESAGRSDGKLTDMSFDTRLSDVRAVVSYARQLEMVDQNNLLLIGHSQGGMMAVLTAMDAELSQVFNGMLICDPYIISESFVSQFAGMEELPESYTVLAATVGRDYISSALKYADFMDQIGSYNKPVLLLLGDQDEIVHGEDVLALRDAFGSNVEFVSVAGGYHDFRDDVLPQLMPDTIIPFLNSLIQ